jgi:hypothetical protein
MVIEGGFKHIQNGPSGTDAVLKISTLSIPTVTPTIHSIRNQGTSSSEGRDLKITSSSEGKTQFSKFIRPGRVGLSCDGESGSYR